MADAVLSLLPVLVSVSSHSTNKEVMFSFQRFIHMIEDL